MAIMNRNVNLEEIGSDAFMGIPFLNHQTTLQKILFIGSIAVGIGLNFLSTFLLHVNANIAVLLTLLPIVVGVAFGCNFNEDLTLFRYLVLILFKPLKKYSSVPTEDIEQIKNLSKHSMENSTEKEKKASPEEQKKMLLKLVVGAALFILLFVVIIALINHTKTDSLHHDVAQIQSAESVQL